MDEHTASIQALEERIETLSRVAARGRMAIARRSMDGDPADAILQQQRETVALAEQWIVELGTALERLKRQRAEFIELEGLRARRRGHAALEHRDAESRRAAAARGRAAEWFAQRSFAYGGAPMPAADVLAAAEVAGHDRASIAAVTTRLRRRRDGVECLGAADGSYLRRDYVLVSDAA